jgi:uncharacterized protein
LVLALGYTLPMRRADVIRLLEDHRSEIAAFGVASLGLFGSVARDEARDDSDIDLLVEFHGPTEFRAHMSLLLFLEDLLGTKVDLATPKMLPPDLAATISRDLMRVA